MWDQYIIGAPSFQIGKTNAFNGSGYTVAVTERSVTAGSLSGSFL
jgi:hypothetical protein